MRPFVQAYYIESSGRECYQLDLLIRVVVVCSESQNGEVLETSGCVVWNLSAEPAIRMLVRTCRPICRLTRRAASIQ